MVIKHRLLTRRVERLIGPAMSAALALAVAFFLLAMPAELMGWMLIAPAVDIGTRLLVAIVAAALAGGASLALFAWLDQKARPPREDYEEPDFDQAEAPVTRGDAPPRPLFAGTELAAASKVAAPEQPVAEPAPAAPVTAEMEEAAEEDDALELGIALTPDMEAALAAPIAGGAPLERASLDELMQRLEVGIAVRGTSAPAASGPGSDPAALRNALEELQRMAARAR